MNLGLGHIAASRKPVPRGIARSGPAVLSYGFRPFFLLAGIFALLSLSGWIGALALGWEIGGAYGALNWHAHEMLFGYTSAALAGFMLTAIPNWTGRLPVSGLPLLGLVAIWVLGRLAMAAPSAELLPIAMLIDACFLPLLAIVAGIEIVAGKNWKNLKILAGLTGLSVANIVFHVLVATSGTAADAARFAVGIYVMLIAVVGGRIIPSFTRNWLVKAGVAALPAPFGQLDKVALVLLLVALVGWALAPDWIGTAVFAALAGLAHAVRLWRWRGGRTLDEPLVFALHAGYAFVPLGLFAVALSTLGWVAGPSALHLLTVGAIGNMTVAVMTRASLGHTGRPLTATLPTSIIYLSLVLAAIVRPFAELIPEHYHTILSLSGALWLIAFGVFVAEYGPILIAPRRQAGLPATAKAPAE